jgi:hypothetical protein
MSAKPSCICRRSTAEKSGLRSISIGKVFSCFAPQLMGPLKFPRIRRRVRLKSDSPSNSPLGVRSVSRTSAEA